MGVLICHTLTDLISHCIYLAVFCLRCNFVFCFWIFIFHVSLFDLTHRRQLNYIPSKVKFKSQAPEHVKIALWGSRVFIDVIKLRFQGESILNLEWIPSPVTHILWKEKRIIFGAGAWRQACEDGSKRHRPNMGDHWPPPEGRGGARKGLSLRVSSRSRLG